MWLRYTRMMRRLDPIRWQCFPRLHGVAVIVALLAMGLLSACGEVWNDPYPQAERLRQAIAAAVEQRSLRYLARYGQESMAVGAVLFDRSRQICGQGPVGLELLTALSSLAQSDA